MAMSLTELTCPQMIRDGLQWFCNMGNRGGDSGLVLKTFEGLGAFKFVWVAETQLRIFILFFYFT